MFGTDQIITMSAALIALSAMFISVWQAIQIRRHSHLSVRPNLRLDFELTDYKPLAVILRNTGTGPAVISSFDIVVNGQHKYPNDTIGINKALNDVDLSDVDFESYSYECGDMISPGEYQLIIKILTKPNDYDEYLRLCRGIERISFRVEYKSIYGKKFLLESKK